MNTEDYLYFEQDDYPFWEYLGLDPQCTVQDAVFQGQRLSRAQKRDPWIRFAWKILKDPFFHDTYKQYRSIRTVYESGFFLDQYMTDFEDLRDVRFLTTPLDKVREQVATAPSSDAPYEVLLMTGGFSPLHQRHLDSLSLAKTACEEAGAIVIGGYLSTSHDRYVLQKPLSDTTMTAEHRIWLMETLTESNPWIAVDRWEALYHAYAINFTDVMLRLESYLNYHVTTPQGIRIRYVFGSDNAAFARAFINHGYGVCIARQSHLTAFEQLRREQEPRGRVIFVDQAESQATSSTAIRQGHSDLLDPSIRAEYLTLKTAPPPSVQNVYGLRHDAKIAFDALHLRDTPTVPWDEVTQHVHQAFRDAFGGLITLHGLSVDHQRQEAQKLIQHHSTPTLSLDPYIRGDRNFDVSRLFELSGSQFHPRGLVARPGCPSIPDQLGAIPDGHYLLIEDDVASGTTLSYLLQQLPASIHIDDCIFLSRLTEDQIPHPLFDIVDVRDFIVGLAHSGLVVTLPTGHIARVPYVLPYTSPASRCTIPLGHGVEFSVAIWKMNAWLYTEHLPHVEIGQMEPGLVALAHAIGLSSHDPVHAFVRWHLRKLRQPTDGKEMTDVDHPH